MADLSGRQLGEFVLHEQIGAGGNGAVYRCEQPALKRAAVVKVLHARRWRSDAARQRFLREAHLASRLDHPYAAHVYSFGAEEDGLLWIAMELVHGITLSQWLKSRGPMPLEQFVPFFERVAEVVHAAHERGIVHRDVKPSNIMVIESAGKLFPKLLDFGIAKLRESHDVEPDTVADEPPVDESVDRVATVRIRATPQRIERTRTAVPVPGAALTHPGVVIGSAPYMSPEQWDNPCAVGPAADLYALGCVAYEALTGRAPFTAANTSEYYDLHLRADPPSLGSNVAPTLDHVVRRALAKRPEARQSSAAELAAELRTTLRTHPREQLRSAAQQWHDRARPPGLLWGGDVLAEIDRWALPAAADRLSELECSFMAASHRRARRMTWVRRSVFALAAITAFAVIQYRSATQTRLAERQMRLAEQKLAEQQTRSARELAEAKIAESELEQGRAALLHGEPEAQAHLTEAYRRDPSPSTAFMLARSMQPRLAELARFNATYGRMWSATFSPDGKQIVTTDDRAAQIWDAETYRLLFTLPHGCEVYQAVYSADGTKLVTAAESMVRLWNATDGTLLQELKAKPGGGAPTDFYRAAISSDANFVAASDSLGSMAYIWDAISGRLVMEMHNAAADFPNLAFSTDGWFAITNGNDVRVFDLQTWRQVLAIPGPRIHSLAFDTHSRLVTGSATGEVALWAIPSGTCLRILHRFEEPVDAVAFSAGGELIVAGTTGGAIRVWHTVSGALQSHFHQRRSKILAVEFDRTSTFVLAANADGTVVIADAAQGLLVAVVEGPQNAVSEAHFDPRSRRIVGASRDGTTRVWDATPPYRRWSSRSMSDDCGIVMGSEPDTRFVAVGCRGRPTRVWDSAQDQLLAELPSVTPVDDGGFMSAFPVVSAAGDRAAIAHVNAVQVYELPGGRLLHTINHGAPVNAVAFASAGRNIVSGAVDGSVLITRDDGAQLALQASGGIDAAALLPDGKVVVSDAQRRLRVYDSRGTVLADLEMPTRSMSLRRSGARLVTLPIYSGAAAPPLLIDLERYRLIAQLEGHVGRVFSARWVAGERVLTAGADGTARLWDGATGQLIQIYRGSSRFLGDATLISDGVVVAGDADGILRFWDAESGAKLWVLQAHKSAVISVHAETGDLVTRGFAGEVSRWTLPRSGQVIEACGNRPHCAIVSRSPPSSSFHKEPPRR